MREHLNQPKEAEAFLREGLRNNPNSYEILFELGRRYNENYHDTDRARNVWQLALRRWMQQDSALQKENQLGLDEITVNLAHLEEGAGNYEDAVRWRCKQMLRRRPLANREIALCFSRAALV
jgi:tetratricopeptide (TPR) repeat protein